MQIGLGVPLPHHSPHCDVVEGKAAATHCALALAAAAGRGLFVAAPVAQDVYAIAGLRAGAGGYAHLRIHR